MEITHLESSHSLERLPVQKKPLSSRALNNDIAGAPNDRFLGNDLKWLVMHPGVL